MERFLPTSSAFHLKPPLRKAQARRDNWPKKKNVDTIVLQGVQNEAAEGKFSFLLHFRAVYVSPPPPTLRWRRGNF